MTSRCTDEQSRDEENSARTKGHQQLTGSVANSRPTVVCRPESRCLTRRRTGVALVEREAPRHHFLLSWTSFYAAAQVIGAINKEFFVFVYFIGIWVGSLGAWGRLPTTRRGGQLLGWIPGEHSRGTDTHNGIVHGPPRDVGRDGVLNL